jgi:hypothetical protein
MFEPRAKVRPDETDAESAVAKTAAQVLHPVFRHTSCIAARTAPHVPSPLAPDPRVSRCGLRSPPVGPRVRGQRWWSAPSGRRQTVLRSFVGSCAAAVKPCSGRLSALARPPSNRAPVVCRLLRGRRQTVPLSFVAPRARRPRHPGHRAARWRFALRRQQLRGSASGWQVGSPAPTARLDSAPQGGPSASWAARRVGASNDAPPAPWPCPT